MKIKCRKCNKSFTAFPSHKRKYCSRTCAAKALTKKQINRKCKYCKKDFAVNASRPKQIFCSVRCGALGGKGAGITLEKRRCPQCKKFFEVETWRITKYCSNQCGVDANKGKTFDKRECLACKKKFTVEAWKPTKYCSVKCGVIGSGIVKRGRPRKKCSDRSPKYREERITKGGKRMRTHRLIMENKIGRRLTSMERVHHIDIDNTNNNISNLWLYSNASDHQKGHTSVGKLVKSLLKMGIIIFKKGTYKLASKAHGKGRGK